MKKRFTTVAIVCTLIGAMAMTSCIGSFGLSNKLLAWNRTIDNKFVNEVVFFAFWVLPVYEVAMLADVLVLNSIEFWSGTSPVAQSRSIIDGQDGKYLVECDGHGYDITSLNDNTKVRLDFDAQDRTWSLRGHDGKTYPLMTFVDADHIQVPTADGQMMTIEKNQQGLYAYRQALITLDLAMSK